MKLSEIIDRVDAVYPDGLIGQLFDKEKQRPVSKQEAEAVGDGLARFIVQELYETYDPDRTTEKQLEDALQAMERACDELEDVWERLHKCYLRDKKGAL